MPSATKDFNVNILGDSTKGQAAFDAFGKKAKGTLTDTGGAFSKFTSVAGGALAAIGLANLGQKVGDFLSGSVDAYKDAQASQTQLTDAYERFPTLTDVSLKSLQDLNSALATKTKFDDDATASGQAALAAYGLNGRQLKELTPLMQDYAAKTGKDLPTAAKDLGKALLGQGRSLKDIGLNFKDAGSVSENFKQLMGGLNDKVGGFATKEGKDAAGQAEILKNQLGEVQETLGGKLMPIIQGFTSFLVTNVVPGLANVAGWVTDNAGLFIGLAAVIGGLVLGWVIYSGVMKTIQMVTGIATAAQWLWNAAISANPISIIIIALLALVAGIIWVAANWDSVSKFLTESWGKIASFATDVWGHVVDFFKDVWEKIVGFFKAAGAWIMDMFFHWTPLGIIIANWGPLSGFFVDLWNGIVSWATRVWNGFIGWLGGVARNFIAGWRNIWNGLASYFGRLWNGISSVVMRVWNGLSGWLGSQVRNLVRALSAIWNGFSGFMNAIMRGISNVVMGIWNGISSWLGAQVGNLVRALQSVWNGFAGFMGGLWNGIAGGVQWVVSVISGSLNGVVGFIGGLPGRIASAAGGMWNGIKDAFRAVLNWVIDRWNGLQFKIPAVNFMGIRTSAFTLGVPRIPHLATGGITNGPMLALIGDNPGGREVVEPLAGYKAELAKERQAGADALAAQSSGSGGGLHLTVETRNGPSVKEIFDEALWAFKAAGWRPNGGTA